MVVIKATNLEFVKELCETSVFILKYDLCPIELILRETYSTLKLKALDHKTEQHD